jgi:hypothetical protein
VVPPEPPPSSAADVAPPAEVSSSSSAHADVAALAVELLERGADVELQSPSGWRLVAHRT